MLPTRTVENYLKAILQAQSALDSQEDLVPMGHLATALGVVPGTATTMVKTLSESGLVRYEPYAGVRLTPAGERLAAMVLRRHRLIELFLVNVMGMSWTEVHPEAEQLEHAVSDRLIERIDEMLGHPATDPHGDPIPGPEGTVRQQEYQSLLSCPLNTPVIVTRVTDQDADFLRFIESSDLKPGQPIQIEARDAAADSVLVRGKDDRRITIGMRAASKLLVEIAQAIVLLLGSSVSLGAQPAASRPFEILDNSFLVEEAFNQPAGVFQNILSLVHAGSGDWEAVFTQEWPLQSLTHQVSYSVPLGAVDNEGGIGDVLLNYRYQLLQEDAGRPAFAPRLSVVLPSGSRERGLGNGVVGWQVNLPFSKQRGDVYWHWNAGFTYLPGVELIGSGLPDEEEDFFSPHLAASAIWRARPMMHLMLETVLNFDEEREAARESTHTTTLTLSPGFRKGWNLADHQLVVGLALPLSFSEDTDDVAVLGYFSYELPFVKK